MNAKKRHSHHSAVNWKSIYLLVMSKYIKKNMQFWWTASMDLVPEEAVILNLSDYTMT